jgi:hypothetical protein
MNIPEAALQWRAGRDTGTSSETIWAVMLGVTPTYPDVPYDPDDFGRCYRLLEAVPEWRDRLHLVADAYPKSAWPKLVDAWSELETMWRAVGYAKKHDRTWDTAAAKRMYDRMRELRGRR